MSSYGIFMTIPAPEVAETVARSGLDFCILDGEHGRFSHSDLLAIVATMKAANQSFKVLYRTPDKGVSHITHALDSGVDGIMVPQVNSAAEAKDVVRAAKFYPLGMRGVHPGVRAAHFGFRPAAEYLSEANRETMVILQVESEAAYSQVDAILEVPGIDMLFPGPLDLSQSLGITGQVNDPRVEKIMTDIAAKALQKGVPCGTFAPSTESADHYKKLGYSLLAIGGDIFIFGQAVKRQAQVFKEDAQ